MFTAQEYKDSLLFKFKSAAYHKDTCREAMKKLEGYSQDDTLAVESEFIAMMMTLHSCLDVFAQYLNVIYKINLSESKVSYKIIIGKIKDNKIKSALFALRNEASYLDDFCNVIKHRNIVRMSFHVAFLSPTFPAHYMDIDSFSRGGRNHSQESIEWQLELQYKTIIEGIEAVLLSLDT